MRIAVCIKWAPDPGTVDVDPISGRVWEQRVLYRVEPSDRVALEQGLRLRERLGGQVAVFTAGPPAADAALREALAMGADTVLRVWLPHMDGADPTAIGQALAHAIRRVEPDLVLCGGIEGDIGSGLVPAVIAETLGLPSVSGVCELVFLRDDPPVLVTRRLEHGEREVLECDLPALLSVDHDLYEPRYPGLPAVLKAVAATPPTETVRTRGNAFTAGLGSGALVRLGPVRPRPRAIFTPDSRLPVWQRVEQIISGGGARKTAAIVNGSPNVLAERIEQYLHERGLL